MRISLSPVAQTIVLVIAGGGMLSVVGECGHGTDQDRGSASVARSGPVPTGSTSML
jgi:hypothetical protein